MQVLPIIPLYPNTTFTQYNVSLGLPGPRLHDIPVAGPYAKKQGFPNTKSSILFPDVDYIKKFANYELGIADGILNATKGFNIAQIGDDAATKSTFNNTFGFASQDGMGLKSLEKTIISSIFESQKPYFTIAQFAIENLISIEDILARVAPLLGAAINPFMALAIQSRKPIGNGPSEDNPLSLTQFGSPPAIGYKGGEEIRGNVNDFRTAAKEGLTIDEKGNVEQPQPETFQTTDLGNYQYDYVTVSVAYSTGAFNPNIEYDVKYIDILDEEEPQPVVDETEDQVDNLPDKIILGIFDSDGTPINPNEKIKFFDVNGNNQLVQSDSIFNKATWITEPDKWILKKSLNETHYWKTLENVQYHWRRAGEIKIQNEQPGNGWEKLKYKDILDFNNENNQELKYREDEFVVTFTQPDTEEYIKYYDSLVDSELENKQIEKDKRPEIKREVSEIYNDEQLKRTLEDLFLFAQMRAGFYNGVEQSDWSNYNNNAAPNETFPEELRKVFKPMQFRIDGQEVWIDPETEYDYKVIRVDSTNKIDYVSGDKVKNSNIQTFVKNTTSFNVIENGNNIPFNIDVRKNGGIDDSVRGGLDYNYVNWDFDGNTRANNSYNFTVWNDKAPKRYNKTIRYGQESDKFPGTRNNDRVKNTRYKKQVRVSEEESFQLSKSGNIIKYNKVRFKYFIDTEIEKDAADRANALTIEAGLLSIINPVLAAQKIKEATDLVTGATTIKKNTFSEIIPLSGGRYTLPDGFEIEIDSNSTITKWILLNQDVNVNSTLNGVTFLPAFFKKNTITIDIDKMGDDKFNINQFRNIETSNLSKFRAQLSENNVISTDLISTNDLIKEELYSTGRYGPGWDSGEIKDQDGNVVGIENGNPQKVGYIRRPRLTELDNETYFIIEGVRKTRNTTFGNGGGGDNEGGDGSGFYRLPDALGIIPVVIKMAISLFTELFPAITNFISLITNPMKFLTDIISFKIADPRTGFNVFSPQSLSIITQLGALAGNASAMTSIVQGSQLANYVFVNPLNGTFKFLLDGPAVIDFFGLVFGINVSFSDRIPITPIFGAIPRSENLSEFLGEDNPTRTDNSNFSDKDGTVSTKEPETDVFKNTDTIPNSVTSQLGNVTTYEEVYITYPEGKKEGIEYDFIYINEEIDILIQQANDLQAEGDISKLGEAKQKLQTAVNKERSKGEIRDENGRVVNFDESRVNQPLIKVLTDKISELTQVIGIADQPIFKMILGVVSTPLKVVLGIIKELIEIFKKFLNPFTLASALAEFLSFQWIMKFFDPLKLLSLAGITFNPLKAAEWCLAVNAKNPLFGVIPGVPEYIVPDDFPIADLSQFLSVSFTATLPTYTAKQYREMCLKPFRLFSPFICFIEQLINSFIMLVWAVMGITAIIPPPFIRICQKLNENIPPEDMMDILNGLYVDNLAGGLTGDRQTGGDGDSYDFIYEVELPDGNTRNLNAEELQEFIDENSNIYYDFTNFSNIE